MASTVSIGSSAEFSKILSTSNIVITDFYADWCGPCKTISPTFESLATKYSKPGRITFTKVNVDSQQAIAQQYGVRAMPTFLIFRSGSVINTIKGADPRGLTTAIENAVKLAGPAKPTFSSQGRTLGGTAPRGTSLARPFNWQGYVDAVLSFLVLYVTTLFTLDAYKAGEDSPFNVNRTAREGGSTVGRSAGAPSLGTKRSGAAVAVGKRLGTIADLSGGD
ncbi:Thioredoxin-like protein [Venustampulla echinocandica]|uniref:Thioredoxin-like protein n=1 Tax=Venustampulla echinocandica TaxID=2656787 RepID=A0A370TKU9_9HELO|nr:Thioredoxin-like protein [Venustampulla echinocandica]RDL36148.1 Thioredoxin-like protein [Venustampulla echinocandica]